MSYQKNSERINELAEKWLSGTITPEEKKEFDQWYEEAGSGAGITSDPAGVLRDRMFAVIATREGLDGGHAAEPRLQPVKSPAISRNRRVVKRVLFAAAIVTFLVLPAWLYREHLRRNDRVVADRGLRHDPVPGSNKATLTLSNGETVSLEPAGRRNISDSSGATIRQLDSGLIYSRLETEERASALSYNTLTVPRGAQYKIVLSDGTAVWLNSASSLRYPTVFRGDDRVVTLTGEGYFEVAKDDDHPFRVDAGGQVIDVLGTQFNVNCYTDEADTRTTLLQGSVRVSLPDAQDPRVIHPGQQAVTANPGQGELRVVEGVDLDQVIAWKNGYFQIDDADIGTIMRQAARWYDVDVVYDGPAPVQRLSGKLRRTASIRDFLDMLSYFNIHFQVQGRKITVTAEGGAPAIHL